jgi:hypothetical protein
MAKVQEYYNIGDRSNLTVEQLLVMLEDMYKDLSTALNKKPDVYIRTTDGQSTDTFLNDGDININSNTLKVEMLTAHPTPTTVTWTTLS